MQGRTLFLHVGPPKTGTTALQALLRDGSAPGLAYPQAGQWFDGAHHELTFALAGSRMRGSVAVPPFEEIAGRMRAEIDAAGSDVLISSELLDPASTGKVFFERFGPCLSARFARIVVVLAARHPLDRAASAYNQDVKDPVIGETRAPDAYLLEDAGRFRLMPLIGAWSRLCPDPIVVNYHPAGTFVRRFLVTIGHGDIPDAATTWRNRSMGGKALLALVAANRLVADGAGRAAFFEALRDDSGFGVWQGPSFPFSAAAVEAFGHEMREDLEAVRRAYGIDLRHVHDGPPERFALSDEQIDEIGTHLATLPGIEERREEMEALFADFRSPGDKNLLAPKSRSTIQP